MPEGHTIYRTAKALDAWLTGRTVTAARTPRDLPVAKLVGRTVTGVEPRGKHLLVRFDNGLTLHTHMKMTGSWHVYRTGEPWRKPAHRACVVLEVEPDRVAVCFDAPVVELLAARGEEQHPALTALGPDLLKRPIDLEEIRRRARDLTAPDLTIGELLLDQRVLAGLGNIWRCEAMFARRIDPFAARSTLPDDDFDALVTTGADLLQRAADGPQLPATRVYGRSGRPCVRCATPIRSARPKVMAKGGLPRTLYWCPTCQAGPHTA